MALDADSSYRYVGSGEPLALEVNGPTMESCVARALEGVTAAIADVHPSLTGRSVALTVDGQSPAALLRNVLAAADALRAGGELAVTVERAELVDAGLRIHVEVVPLRSARVAIDPELTWHHLALDRRGGQWVGHLVADR